jgi:hypothetical protein
MPKVLQIMRAVLLRSKLPMKYLVAKIKDEKKIGNECDKIERERYSGLYLTLKNHRHKGERNESIFYEGSQTGCVYFHR